MEQADLQSAQRCLWLQTWQIRYCEADYASCERYRVAKNGDPVPLQLLPNGRTLPVPSKKPPPP